LTTDEPGGIRKGYERPRSGRAELVIANRILATEDVVDAYGHVSVRHPDDP